MENPKNQGQAIRRAPAVLRKIKDILPDDIRVSVYCTVIDSRDMELRVDDGTAQAVVAFEDPNLFEKVRGLRRIRVFGKPFKDGPRQIISAEIVQDMSKLDTKLLERVMQCSQ